MSEDPETSSGCVASGLSIERRKSNRIFIRKRAERKGRELWLIDMLFVRILSFYDFVTGHINNPVIAYYYNRLPVAMEID